MIVGPRCTKCGSSDTEALMTITTTHEQCHLRSVWISSPQAEAVFKALIAIGHTREKRPNGSTYTKHRWERTVPLHLNLRQSQYDRLCQRATTSIPRRLRSFEKPWIYGCHLLSIMIQQTHHKVLYRMTSYKERKGRDTVSGLTLVLLFKALSS